MNNNEEIADGVAFAVAHDEFLKTNMEGLLNPWLENSIYSNPFREKKLKSWELLVMTQPRHKGGCNPVWNIIINC